MEWPSCSDGAGVRDTADIGIDAEQLLDAENLAQYLSDYTLQQLEEAACFSDCLVRAQDGMILCSSAMLGSVSKVLRRVPEHS